MLSRRDRRLGVAYVEFVLVAAFFLVPLVLGLVSVGFTLSRSLQVAQLTRDVGRMVVRGADFSRQSNQDLITGDPAHPDLPALARGLGMVRSVGTATGGTSGNGVLVLSTMTKVSTTCNCGNAGHIAVSRRIVVGNRTLFTTTFGAPSSGLISGTTGIVSNYTTDVTARADNFSTVVDLASGEFGYLVETKFNFPDLAIPGVMSNPGVFWRSVF
jgi:Flp pilus assembly protein TadG